ncbi:MAG: hypothetical protein GY710_08425 [Desulfobacteraceae bacterium]|nr:hypothetical protein [Desulfobacteraceae bacterium]
MKEAERTINVVENTKKTEKTVSQLTTMEETIEEEMEKIEREDHKGVGGIQWDENLGEKFKNMGEFY